MSAWCLSSGVHHVLGARGLPRTSFHKRTHPFVSCCRHATATLNQTCFIDTVTHRLTDPQDRSMTTLTISRSNCVPNLLFCHPESKTCANTKPLGEQCTEGADWECASVRQRAVLCGLNAETGRRCRTGILRRCHGALRKSTSNSLQNHRHSVCPRIRDHRCWYVYPAMLKRHRSADVSPTRLGMLSVCGILIFIHKRQRDMKRREINEYYREQTA